MCIYKFNKYCLTAYAACRYQQQKSNIFNAVKVNCPYFIFSFHWKWMFPLSKLLVQNENNKYALFYLHSCLNVLSCLSV